MYSPHGHFTPNDKESRNSRLRTQRELLRASNLISGFIGNGFLDADFMLFSKLSNGEKSVLAYEIGKRLQIDDFWCFFEDFWEMKWGKTYYQHYKDAYKYEKNISRVKTIK